MPVQFLELVPAARIVLRDWWVDLARRAANEKQKRRDDERQDGARKSHRPVLNRGATAPLIVDTDVDLTGDTNAA